MKQKWKLLELYPQYKNSDVTDLLQKNNIKYFIVMKGFIKAELEDALKKDFEMMAYIHDDFVESKY